MTSEERIVKAIYTAVDELNKKYLKGVQLEKAPDTVLYGKNGKLETSLDFVTFIMEVEEQIQNEFGVDVMISVDEDLLANEDSPFTTLGTLTEYVKGVMKENGINGN